MFVLLSLGAIEFQFAMWHYVHAPVKKSKCKINKN